MPAQGTTSSRLAQRVTALERRLNDAATSVDTLEAGDSAVPTLGELLELVRYAFTRIEYLEGQLDITYGRNDLRPPDEVTWLEE